MRKNLTLPIIFILLISIRLPVMASEIQVQAIIKENRLEVGQSTTLTIQIQGDANASAPEVDVSDWEVQYYGPSTQVSIVNGKRSESVSHLYSLSPLKAGQLEIPAIEVKYKRQSYWTQPIQVTVDEQGQGQSKTLADQLKDLVFLEIGLDREKIYLNEEIPVTINLYFHEDIQLKNVHYPELGLENNFLQSQMNEPKQKYKVRNGQYFNLIPFKTTIQGISKGKYTFRPTLTTDIAIPRKNRSRDPFESFFGSNYDLYTLNLQAPELTLLVQDFPAEGKPADFQGAVGRFQMEVTVTPKEVQVGEPMTIRTRFTGEGNYDSLTAPMLEKRSEFKYYDAQMITEKGDENNSNLRQEKVFEQVVIPTQRVDVLPTVSFSYFDPEREEYQTIEKSGIGILVVGDSDEATRQVMDYRKTKGPADQVLGQDILYIKATPGSFKPVDQGLFTAGTIGYPAGLILILLVGSTVKWKLAQETPAQRKRKVVTAETRMLLNEGAQMIQQGQEKTAFYNTIYQAVQNYLKEYFQITITGISDYENGVLVKAGLDAETLEKIESFYRKMDEMRYAGAFSSEQDMKQVLELAQEIITEIEKGEVA